MPPTAATHAIEMGVDTVSKQFRSWERGEHRREWDALVLLAAYAPGLAPAPIEADLTADPPTVTMSRLDGDPVNAASIGPEQIGAMAVAIDALHRAVPDAALAGLRPRLPPLPAIAGKARRRCLEPLQLGCDPLVREAFAEAVSWLDSPSLDGLLAAEVCPVFGHGDGNLANYLWDGSRARIVDFENSGRSDRAVELADISEHLSTTAEHGVATADLLAGFELTRAESERLREARRLYAFDWLLMLLPGGPAHDRNPPGTLRRQADRMLDLLG